MLWDECHLKSKAKTNIPRVMRLFGDVCLLVTDVTMKVTNDGTRDCYVIRRRGEAVCARTGNYDNRKNQIIAK